MSGVTSRNQFHHLTLLTHSETEDDVDGSHQFKSVVRVCTSYWYVLYVFILPVSVRPIHKINNNWKPLMWLAPNIFRTDVSLMTGTFPCLSTVSLAPFVMGALSHWHLFFKSTLSQGHLPLCDIHTYTHTHTHTTTPFLVTFWITFGVPFVNKIWIDPTWLVGGNLDRPHLTS